MPDTKPIRVAILYPSDPAGDNIGGIESFVRGLLLAAPADVHYTVFGATTDPIQRPVGQLRHCEYGRARFDYFPLYVLTSNQRRSFVPTTITYFLNFLRKAPDLSDFDVVECHRIEQLFLLTNKFKGICNLFLHNATAEVVKSRSSDMRWKWIPGIYNWLERKAFDRVDNVLLVTEQGAQLYQQKYPEKADCIGHIPTVVNTDLFYPLDEDARRSQRAELTRSLNIADDDALILFVGRLDSSKNPALLLSAYAELRAKTDGHAALLFVGDGVLAASLKRQVAELQIPDYKVHFLGFKTPEQVADIMRVCDLFALSSAYEGMPISVLEALRCGLPVISTDVGAIRRVVVSDLTGEVVDSMAVADYASALIQMVGRLSSYSDTDCVQMVEPYSPANVFARVFDRYRTLLAERACPR